MYINTITEPLIFSPLHELIQGVIQGFKEYKADEAMIEIFLLDSFDMIPACKTSQGSLLLSSSPMYSNNLSLENDKNSI